MTKLALVLTLLIAGCGSVSPQSDAPPTTGDAPRRDAGAVDGPGVDGPGVDAPPAIRCGTVTCNPGEWCDPSGILPACMCGQSGSGQACEAGATCCHNLSGCAPAHCDEYCADRCTAR